MYLTVNHFIKNSFLLLVSFPFWLSRYLFERITFQLILSLVFLPFFSSCFKNLNFGFKKDLADASLEQYKLQICENNWTVFAHVDIFQSFELNDVFDVEH